ncbi:MAG TPA: hypothetical protein VGN72_19720 [Tepidisphaeraceae bacterium]|jgi:hypothetical protein|nr:hypothetical protein [Tepidisphaeraceae bacterium]
MSSPSSSTATPRADLAVTLEEYDLEASRQGFVGHKLFPVFDAAKVAGTWRVLGADEMLQDHPTERAPDGSYNRAGFSSGEKSYTTKERGFEVPIDDNLREQYREYFEAEVAGTEIARDVVLRGNEQKAVAYALNAANNGGTHAMAVKLDQTNADPVGEFREAMIAVRNKGYMPNMAVLEWEALMFLSETPQIIDKLGAANSKDAKIATLEVIARILKIDEIVVANAQRNAAIRSQDATKAKLDLRPLWDKTKIWVGHVDKRNRLQLPTYGRTFHWTADGSQIGGLVETYRDERVRGDVVRVRNQVDVNQVVEECGYLITDVL